MSKLNRQALQKTLSADQAILLLDPTDIRWLTGFVTLDTASPEARLLLTAKQAFLFHASFSPTPTPDKTLTLIPSMALTAVKSILSEQQLKTILTPLAHLPTTEYLDLVATVKVLDFDRQQLWQQRMIKTAKEQENIRTASEWALTAFSHWQTQLVVGMTEITAARLLEIEMLKLGSEQPAFPTIVAFGDHTTLPHHQPTERALTLESPILVDWGATYHGFRSDHTRCWWYGNKPEAKFVEIETVVQQAYAAALTRVSQLPVTASQLDRAARQVIDQAGFGSYFIHTTGHGLGLSIHEPPSISSQNDTPLAANMAITIEPGIYLPSKFGYRYENTVLITNQGPAVLDNGGIIV